jgi:hypothetical protein
MKVPVYDGRVAMDVTDSAGKAVAVDTDNIANVFPKRVEASIVVSPGIYVSGQGWGVTWRVSYARVTPPTRTTAADVFKDEIEQELKAGPAATQQVTDYDQQDETPEEEEVSVPFVETPTAPTPAPVPAKTNRRRVAVA